MIYFGMILLMTCMGATASVFFKRASGSENFWNMMLNIHLYIGGGLYLAAALINIMVLRHMDYSVVLPLTSITYIWTMVLSSAILKEKITKKKIMGVLGIIIGAACIAA